MAQIQKTTSLTIDDVVTPIEETSAQIQQLVATFDDWRQEELDAQSKLLMVRAALRDLQREIYNAVVAERTPATPEVPATSEVPAESA